MAKDEFDSDNKGVLVLMSNSDSDVEDDQTKINFHEKHIQIYPKKKLASLFQLLIGACHSLCGEKEKTHK